MSNEKYDPSIELTDDVKTDVTLPDGGSDFTFTAKVPANATRLSVTLDLQPRGAQSGSMSPTTISVTADTDFAEPAVEVHEAGEVPQGELTPNSADDVESEPDSAEFLNIDADCDVRWRVATH